MHLFIMLNSERSSYIRWFTWNGNPTHGEVNLLPLYQANSKKNKFLEEINSAQNIFKGLDIFKYENLKASTNIFFSIFSQWGVAIQIK